MKKIGDGCVWGGGGQYSLISCRVMLSCADLTHVEMCIPLASVRTRACGAVLLVFWLCSCCLDPCISFITVCKLMHLACIDPGFALCCSM